MKFWISAALFFLVIVGIRTGAAYVPNWTMAYHGDGIGTIAWIYDIHQTILQEGWRAWASDVHQSPFMGGGLNETGFPYNVLWKTVHFGLGFFLSPDNVYDFVASLGLFLIGMTGALFARRMGLSTWAAVGYGFLLTTVPTYFGRVNGHLTLAIFFGPILVLWSCYRMAASPSFATILTTAAVCLLNLLLNEYYGYFGFFFAIGTALYTLITQPVMIYQRWRGVLAGTVVGAISFVLLASLLYPTMVGQRLVGSPDQSQPASSIDEKARTQEIFAYSVTFPWKIYRPKADFLRPITFNSLLDAKATPEYYNEVGYINLLTGLIFTFLVLLRSRHRRRDLFRLGFLWLTVSIAGYVAMRPTEWNSLSRITVLYAPMFRVPVRVMIFAEIATLLIFAWAIQSWLTWAWHCWKKTSPQWKTAGVASLIGAVVVVLIQFYELFAGLNPFFDVHPMKMHTAPVYSDLRTMPDGHVIAFPFHHPSRHPVEKDYPYHFGRIYHQKPMINGISYTMLGHHLDRMGEVMNINALGPDIIDKLADSGVRYLVVHGKRTTDFPVPPNPRLKLVADEAHDQIYTIDTPRAAYDPKRFAELFFTGKPWIYPARFFDPRLGSDDQPLVLTRDDTRQDQLPYQYIRLKAGDHCIRFVLSPLPGKTMPLHRTEVIGRFLEVQILSDQTQDDICFNVQFATAIQPRLKVLEEGKLRLERVEIHEMAHLPRS